MSKTKQKLKKSGTAGNPVNQKKIKREEQRQQKQQLQAKRQRYYGISIVVIIIAVILSFASGPVYGKPLYHWLQLICYGFMAICGLFTIVASRYEETDKKQQRMRSIGLVFMMVAVAMGIWQLVEVFT